MARSATADELIWLRSENQSTRLKLFIYNPAAVFTARVAAVPNSNDNVSQVSIDTITGAVADVMDGMTCLIGTAAGGYDVGIVRARAATTTLLTLGTTSDILWAIDQYITILPDFRPWARPLLYGGDQWRIDGDVSYSDQLTNFQPVPVLGPAVAVLPYSGSPVTFTPTAANSWVPGSTISGYSWAAPGASTTADLATATPTITYNAPGVYRVRCMITAATGKTATGHRLVYVPGAGALPATQISVDRLTGEQSSGGWQFSVTMYDSSELVGIHPMALVALYAEDYYGATQRSIGPVTGYENVIAIGRIDGGTINWSPEVGQVQFTVKGVCAWLDKISVWPAGLVDTTSTPADWLHVQGLTVDHALWYLTTWRSTLSKLLDVYPSGDTRRIAGYSGSAGKLLEQFRVVGQKIGAEPLSDRYGRLFLDVDAQLVPVASRGAIPIVMDLTKGDWQETINLQKRDSRQVSMIEVSGVAYINGFWKGVIARAPGNSLSHTGDIPSNTNIVYTDQANANETATLLYAKENNPFPVIPIKLAANNRLVDIAPRQYLTLSIAAADTPVGVVWISQPIIPRRVELFWDPESGLLATDVECEMATVPISPSVAVIPATVLEPNLPELPDWDAFDWPIVPGIYGDPDNYLPPDIPVDPDSTCHTTTAAPANGPFDLGLRGTYTEENDVSAGFKCYIRSSYHTNLTRYELHGRFQVYDHSTGTWSDTDDDDFYRVQAGSIIGVKDAVSNPNIRTGILPGGEASQLISLIALAWTSKAILRPDVVSVTFARDNPVFTLDSSGTQVWWPKGAGLGFAWNGITGHTGGGPTRATAYFEIRFQAPAGVSYNRKWRTYQEITWTGGTLDASGNIVAGGGLTYVPIGNYRRAPTDENQHFATWYCPITLKDAFTTKHCIHPWEWNTSWAFDISGEIQPCPDHRIVLEGFYLYNVCPPTA